MLQTNYSTLFVVVKLKLCCITSNEPITHSDSFKIGTMKRYYTAIVKFILFFSLTNILNGFSCTITRNRTVMQLGAASRREAISALFIGVGFSGSILISPMSSTAVDKVEPIIWKSGKPPIVPGQKPKDGNDVKGTRKDPDFLRSISTCKSQCENTLGSDGYAKSKEECLSDCQVCMDVFLFYFIWHNKEL